MEKQDQTDFKRDDNSKRRRRPPISCTLCRKRKIRCNRESPCKNCLRSKNAVCVYEGNAEDGLTRARPDGPDNGEPARAYSDSTSTLGNCHGSLPLAAALDRVSLRPDASPASEQSWDTVDSLKSRIRELELQLSFASRAQNERQTSVLSSSDAFLSRFVDGGFHIVGSSIMTKNRLYGQSHWIHGAAIMLRDFIVLFEGQSKADTEAVFKSMHLCKALSRKIKSLRQSEQAASHRPEWPAREVCDELLENYLRTSESIYRVLHVPSLRRDYEAFWDPSVKSSPLFTVQLKLVLAIGSAMYGEHFPLKTQATQWVRTAQELLEVPFRKSRLCIAHLQAMILLCLARQVVGFGADLVWILIGSVVRESMAMGLHRDPMTKKSAFTVEMRRRLFNTILEMCVQTSVDLGWPAMISLGDFDTEPPSNLDDDQLSDKDSADPVAKRHDCFTQTSVAIALRSMLPARLSIAKYLNDIRSPRSYAETLKLDRDLRDAYKRVARVFQAQKSSDRSASPSQFQLHAVEFVLHRYTLALHTPFLEMSFRDATCAYTRKAAVEASIKLWRMLVPAGFPTSLPPTNSIGTNANSDFTRYALTTSGSPRSIVFLATLELAMEIKGLVAEDDAVGPAQIRPDLLAIVGDSTQWALERIKRGDTNVKGYFVAAVMAAQIDATVKGLARPDTERNILQAAEEAGKACVAILQEMYASMLADQGTQAHSDGEAFPVDDADLDHEWDVDDMMQDVDFDFGAVDPLFGITYDFAADSVTEVPWSQFEAI